eukprot:CAMPEP_0114338704 /NCGR_PEP_ID=MMETSP0101-20121206/7213_1 /TAXON_ID=38822 ORGANISM="Pteridomonas danica, Strain PT" /NCGR_SAMPLE_ID=MMETSP0101 /ASSEMBLY_ACC=CAM_ASM_000211 /LENGTH=438 /DNA_ID=CAMNT_0001471373 /DNA_START=539 /DNA_END=1855 /DNA_ORIENTATION=-
MVEKVVLLVRVAFTFVAIYDAEQYSKMTAVTPTTTQSTEPTSSLRQRLFSAFTPSKKTELITTPPPRTPSSTLATPRTPTRFTLSSVQNTVRSNLMHWIVFSIFLCAQRFASSLPFVGSFGRLVGADERLKLAYALILLWLQLPIGAVQLAYDYVVPLLEHHAPVLFSPRSARASKATEKSQERVQQLGSMLRLVTMSGLLTVERADTLREICSDGWVLLGCVFFITPSVLTQYGVLLCGLIYPSACSALLVTDHAVYALPSQVRWLKYWCVYALMLHGGHELESVGLWSWMIGAHYFHLCLVIYLQLPYFRGAARGHALIMKLLSGAVVLLLGDPNRPASPAKQSANQKTPQRSSSPDLKLITKAGVESPDLNPSREDLNPSREEECHQDVVTSLRQRKKPPKPMTSDSESSIPSAAAAIQAEMMDAGEDDDKEKAE